MDKILELLAGAATYVVVGAGMALKNMYEAAKLAWDKFADFIANEIA